MRALDRILGWFLVVLGCVHNFIAAPIIYSDLSLRALWFVGTGLALWYAGFLNLLRAYRLRPGRMLAALCFLANLSMLAFVLTFAASQGIWAAPEAVALITAAAVLFTISSVTLFQVVRQHWLGSRQMVPGRETGKTR